MTLPKRRHRPPMGLRSSTVIRCPGHLKWVRGHECAVAKSRAHGDCSDRIEAHHVREGAHGQGIGQKPDDSTAVPLCAAAHQRGHSIGWQTFESLYGVSLAKIAEDLWKASPHGVKWRRENG